MTVQLRDSDGTVRLSGDLLATGGATGDVLTQQADGTYTPATPSGATPTQNVGQCRLDFSAVAAGGAITFVFGQGDNTFIDLTDPQNPEPIAAGIYAYTLVVNQDGGGADGAFNALLVVDDDFYSVPVSEGATGGGFNAKVSPSVSWYSGAGSPFHALISDSSADTYSGALYVQCLAGAALG